MRFNKRRHSCLALSKVSPFGNDDLSSGGKNFSVKIVVVAGHVGTHLFAVPALGEPRQNHEFEAILHYIREFKGRWQMYNKILSLTTKK